MSYIGARVHTWREIAGKIPENVQEIIEYVKSVLGYDIRNVTRDGSDRWFADQRLVSILVKRWDINHGLKKVKYVKRNLPAKPKTK